MLSIYNARTFHRVLSFLPLLERSLHVQVKDLLIRVRNQRIADGFFLLRKIYNIHQFKTKSMYLWGSKWPFFFKHFTNAKGTHLSHVGDPTDRSSSPEALLFLVIHFFYFFRNIAGCRPLFDPFWWTEWGLSEWVATEVFHVTLTCFFLGSSTKEQ